MCMCRIEIGSSDAADCTKDPEEEWNTSVSSMTSTFNEIAYKGSTMAKPEVRQRVLTKIMDGGTVIIRRDDPRVPAWDELAAKGIVRTELAKNSLQNLYWEW